MTHAIAQEKSGVTWFATDGGLAMFDGRRTHAATIEGLPPGRILGLQVDDYGGLWVGTDNGAARSGFGRFDSIKETEGKVITAIILPAPDRAILASESGQIFDCHFQLQSESISETGSPEPKPAATFAVKSIPSQPLQSADKDAPGLLKITSLALAGNKLYVGTQSRGLLVIENGEAKEIVSKPRSFFINALEADEQGHLWVGARAGKDESGIFDQTDSQKPVRANAATGPMVERRRERSLDAPGSAMLAACSRSGGTIVPLHRRHQAYPYVW